MRPRIDSQTSCCARLASAKRSTCAAVWAATCCNALWLSCVERAAPAAAVAMALASPAVFCKALFSVAYWRTEPSKSSSADMREVSTSRTFCRWAFCCSRICSSCSLLLEDHALAWSITTDAAFAARLAFSSTVLAIWEFSSVTFEERSATNAPSAWVIRLVEVLAVSLSCTIIWRSTFVSSSTCVFPRAICSTVEFLARFTSSVRADWVIWNCAFMFSRSRAAPPKDSATLPNCAIVVPDRDSENRSPIWLREVVMEPSSRWSIAASEPVMDSCF